MKLKNNWKRFWTLDRHHAAGFTLVELIVVIAILAILAGVGIPVYSGYITKANKQADITLINDVATALSLGYYADTITEGGYVVLQTGTAPIVNGNGVADAMAAAFGDSWSTNETLQLKTDWNAEYTQSSFAGNETKLTGNVEGLTNALREYLVLSPGSLDPNGTGFEEYMRDELGFSAEDITNPEKAADAAVLYIANGTKNLTPDQIAAMKAAVATPGGMQDKMDIINDFNDIYGSYIMSAAATYAMFIGYIQYEDKLAGNTNLMDSIQPLDPASISDPTQVLNAIRTSFAPAFSQLGTNSETGYPRNWEQYWTEQAAGDVDAFVDAMGTVTDAKDLVAGTIKDGTMDFSSNSVVSELFAAYSNGGVMIQIKADGTLVMPELG